MYRSFGASFVYITPRACRADICPVSRFAAEGQTMRIPLQSATQEKCAGRTAERAYRPARKEYSVCYGICSSSIT